jgi:hypothetical protein
MVFWISRKSVLQTIRWSGALFLTISASFGASFDDQHMPQSLNPGYMGPNALPVPEMHASEVGNEVKASLMAEGHIKPQSEFSTNPRFSFFIPFSERTALIFNGEPVEYYSTTEALQKERRAKERKGFAPGDLYFGGMFQITSQSSFPIATSLNIMTKSTTGKELESARHTDAPGYIIDLAAGRDLEWQGMRTHLSTYMAFLAWQTDIGEQNDAFGQAIHWDLFPTTHHKISTELAHYLGTQSEKDRPVVIRTGYTYVTQKWEVFTLYSHGLRDMIQHSVRVGWTYKLDVSRHSLMGWVSVP